MLSDPNTRGKIVYWMRKKTFEAIVLSEVWAKPAISVNSLETCGSVKAFKQMVIRVINKFTLLSHCVNPIWIPTNLESIKHCNQLKILFQMRKASLKGSESGRKRMKHVSWSIEIIASHNIWGLFLHTMAYYGLLWLSDSLHLPGNTTAPNSSDIKSRYIHVTVMWMYNLHPLSHRFYRPRIDTPTTP